MTPTSRSWRSRVALPALAIGALTVFSACAKDAPQDTWQPAGENARKIDDLQQIPFLIAGIVLLIVVTVVGFALIRFRDRGQPIPHQTHGKPALEITLTVLPALILVAIGVPTVSTVLDLAKSDDTQCVINVTGQQWWWEYDYPVQDGCGGITEPIITSGQLVFPEDTHVLLRITSRDVIHSYWIPKLNGKKDAVPGRIHTLRMQADQPGIYAGQCTEFCGLSHAYMRMEAVSLTAEGFETWKANQLKAYTPPTDQDALDGEAAFTANCSRCHQVNGLQDTLGNPVISRPDLYVYAQAAPNLTHLMTRNTFAGATYDLLTPACRDRVWNASPEEFTDIYLEGVTEECLDAVRLREWLRDATSIKPMYAEADQLDKTDGKTRGMPNLSLSEDQIDDIIAYLSERK